MVDIPSQRISGDIYICDHIGISVHIEHFKYIINIF